MTTAALLNYSPNHFGIEDQPLYTAKQKIGCLYNRKSCFFLLLQLRASFCKVPFRNGSETVVGLC